MFEPKEFSKAQEDRFKKLVQSDEFSIMFEYMLYMIDQYLLQFINSESPEEREVIHTRVKELCDLMDHCQTTKEDEPDV